MLLILRLNYFCCRFSLISFTFNTHVSCRDFVTSCLWSAVEEILPWQPGRFVYLRNTWKKTLALGDHKLWFHTNGLSLYFWRPFIHICLILIFLCMQVFGRMTFYSLICHLFFHWRLYIFADGLWVMSLPYALPHVDDYKHFVLWLLLMYKCPNASSVPALHL